MPKAPGWTTEDATPDRVDVVDVVGILRRRIAWLIGAPLILVALTGGYALVASPAYTATAQVYVDPRDRRAPKDDPNPNAVPGDGLLLVESQLKIITSDEVLNRVIDAAGLERDPEFNGERPGVLGALKRVFGLGEPTDRRLAALRNLRLKTGAKRIDRSFVIDIMASADTRDRATTIANALAAAYLEEQPGADSKFNRQLSETIGGQLERLRSAVTSSEDAVAAYKAQNGLIGHGNRLVTEQQLDEANTQLTNAKSRLAEAQARMREVDSVRKVAALETLPEAVQSATITQLRGRAADISREESKLATTDGPRHPALLAAQAEKRDVEAAIARELSRIAQAVHNTAASEKRNVQTLQADFDALKVQAEANDKLLVPLRELERTAEANRATYEAFLGKAKTAKQQEGLDLSNIRLITEATPPESKSWPPSGMMLAAALFGGLALGVALALGRDYFGQAAAAKPLPEEGRQRQRQPVGDVSVACSGHIVVFVRLPSCPLDSTPLEVARDLATEGEDVLLIDADLKRRRLTTRLRLGARQGLSDLLQGAASVSGAAQWDKDLKVTVLPAGRGVAPRVDSNTRRALKQALDEARGYDRVIVEAGEIGDFPSHLGLYDSAAELILLVPDGSERRAEIVQAADALRRERPNTKVVSVRPYAAAAA